MKISLTQKDKHIIIIEGCDGTGKTQLCKHIQDISNGKCHILHSNFNKELPKSNHRRQHKLIAKFVSKQFSKRYYTGNNIVILDRNYVSDMTYGMIGYGSRGNIESKSRYLGRLLSLLKRNKDVDVHFIYCRTKNSAFDPSVKEELLSQSENNKMSDIYENIMINHVRPLCLTRHIQFVIYDFNQDSEYKDLDKYLFIWRERK